MKYLIGIDIGTTAVKAVIVDIDGNIVVNFSRFYGLLFPQEGWAEQDAEEMWQAVAAAMDGALERYPYDRKDILGLSLSTQRDTMVCVDEQERPVRHAITWMDGRSKRECQRLSDCFGADRVYDITGVGVNTIWTFAFILWMREAEPENFARTACFGLVHDYILCRLGAKEHWLDMSNACQTMLFDYRAGVWSPELMAYGGLDTGRLPQLVPPGTCIGTLAPELAERWGLSETFCLVSGGGDQQCAALGAGAVGSGDVEIGIGTAANLLAVTKEPVADPLRRMICHRSAVEGQYVLEGAMLAMGRIMEWLNQEIFPYASLKEIDRLIEDNSKPGASGVIVLPHFEGAACPYWNPEAVGMIYGLRLSTGKAELARAVMEGTAMEIKKSLDLLEEFGMRPPAVRISGGAAGSGTWMQILADVLEVKVQIPKSRECAALGAAILAGLGCGAFRDALEAAARMNPVGLVYYPGEEYAAVYRQAYEKNKTLYAQINEKGI